jgi:hypothetical protein
MRDPRLQVACVGLLSITLAGYLIGYSTAKSAHQAAALTSSISTVASLEHPRSWQDAQLPQGYGALASSLRQPLVLSPRGRSTQAGLIAGVVRSLASPLPATLLASVSSNPRAEVVTMVTAQAYRYRDLASTTSDLLVTAYAVPIGGDREALEVCYARTGASAVQHECEQIAEGLAAPSEPVDLTPDGHIAGVLRSLIPQLLDQRLAIRGEMHTARSPAAIAGLAARMAAVFAAPIPRLDSLPSLTASGKAIANLTAALRGVQHAYATYADDARAERSSDYPSAEREVNAAESALGSALESLSLIGY